ncbi:uncharacterized protein LOC144123228 [Amblyomma americanum]
MNATLNFQSTSSCAHKDPVASKTCRIFHPYLTKLADFYQRLSLSIETAILGVRSEKNTPPCALQQETAALLHEEYSGRVEIYTDGSVLDAGASVAAACAIPSLGITRQCRLPFSASSTTAEVAALHLAADHILETPDLSPAVVLSDSRAALATLQRADHTLPMYASLESKLRRVRNMCRDVSLQWLPSHVGIQGNEQADQLAKQAHADSTPVCTATSSFDVARQNIRARIVAQHPDDRMAAGNAPRPIRSSDFEPIDRSILLKMRIGCVSTAERMHRLRGATSPLCKDCGAIETLDHLLSKCPALLKHRNNLQACYRRLALPCDSAQQLLFPAGPREIT